MSAGDVHIGNDYQAGSMGFSNANWGMLFRAPNSPSDFNYGFQDVDGDNLFTIDPSGDATFSGRVNAALGEFGSGSSKIRLQGAKIWRSDSSGSGLYFLGAGIRPIDSTGTESNGVLSLGTSAAKFKDGLFSGTVTSQNTRSDLIIQDGAPVVDSLQIIRAFMKLRDAVDDPDSSVEQLRDKLKVAVIDIIDQFQDLVDTTPAPDTMPVPVED